MKNKALFYLLRIIDSNSDLAPLINMGYYYSQIAQLLQKATEDEYLIYDNFMYTLSKKGVQFLKSYRTENNLEGIERWLPPQSDKKLYQFGKYDIILPDKL